MQVKRFVAADMSRALAMVREELGDDAMILSTQRTSAGVELTASVEGQELPPVDAESPFDRLEAQSTGLTKKRKAKGSLSPRIEPRVSDEQLNPLSFNEAPSYSRGMASGKTNAQLTQELEQAREKMLASQKAKRMTLADMAASEKTTAKVSSKSSPNYYSHATDRPSQPSKTEPMNEAGFEARIEKILSKQLHLNNNQSQQADQEIKHLQNELHAMRALFEQQLASMADMQQQFQNEFSTKEVLPIIHSVKQRLGQLGLNQATVDTVIQSLKSFDGKGLQSEGLWKESLARLSHRILTVNEDQVMQGGMFAFWGANRRRKNHNHCQIGGALCHGNRTSRCVAGNHRSLPHCRARSIEIFGQNFKRARESG